MVCRSHRGLVGAGALKGVEFIKRWDSESPEGSKGKGKGKGGGGE